METPSNPRPVPHPVRALRRFLGGVAVVTVGVMVAAGVVAFEGQQATAAAPVSTSVTQSLYQGAVGGFKLRRLQAIGEIAVAESVVASARLVLDTSSGKVLSEKSRAALLERIRIEEARVASARQEIEVGNRITDPSFRAGSYFAERPGLHVETAVLGAYRFPAASGLAVGRENLAAPVKAVQKAVTAWKAEQARIAAEKARIAAEKAAARAAADRAATSQPYAQQGTGRSSGSGGGQSPARASSYNKYVWTYGWQAQIDACRGAVDITAHYGVAVIAEHWRCGGSSFPGAGSIITLSGVRSGTYRVGSVVAVLNISTDSASDVPRGYGLLYQTCINGSSARMAFTVLTRVGG